MKRTITFLFSAITFITVANAQVKKTTTVKSKSAISAKKTGNIAAKPVIKTKPAAKPVTDTSVRIKITTDSGTIIVKLYDSTPLHRDNFVKLVSSRFYDSLLFHRVIPQFMIQGGDPLSKNAEPGSQLGNGGGDMARIPAEFRPTLIHKRGVLAAARDNNPEKASSACQFYLVHGRTFTDQELNMFEARSGKKYTAAEKQIYKTIGGTAMLDMAYTVFGEVESGMEVIDKIANVARNPMDRPLGDVRMYMEVVNNSTQKK